MRLHWGLIALFVSHVALADFKSEYDAGLRAAKRKDWQGVETSMRAALAQEPKSQARVRIYGMRFEPYLPHHYLALAASARGECAQVLASLNEPSHIAALAQSSGGASLAAAEAGLRARCDGAQVAATPKQPEPPPVQSAPVSIPSAPTTTPVNVPEAAVKRLSSAEISSVRSSVQNFRRDLSALRAELNRPELADFARDKQSELQRLTRSLETLSADSERAISTQDSRLLTQSSTAARAGSTSVSSLRQALKTALAAAAPAVRPTPPEPLRQLAQLYFSGEFAKAAQANVDALQGKALAHALLLRAAARFSLYVAQGEARAEQLQPVKEDLARAKRTDPTVRPNAKYFSPRLIQLF